MPVIANPFLGIIFYTHILIFLGVQEHLLAPFLIFEAEFVKSAATFAAVGFDGGHRRIVRQRIRRLGFVVVNRAGDDRSIGVAFEKFDNDFLADARDKYRAPILPGPGLRDARPNRGVFIGGTVAVPVKLNFNPPEFVGQNFFAGLTDDNPSLRTLDARFGRGAGWAKNAVGRDRGEIAQEPLF